MPGPPRTSSDSTPGETTVTKGSAGEAAVVKPTDSEAAARVPAAAGSAGRSAKWASVHPRWQRLVDHPDAAPLLLGLVLALAVCWPLLGGRPLFLLDWVSGPHPPLPSTTMLGLDGGLTAGVVGGVVMTILVRTIGEASTWLVLFAFFPVAAVGAARLAGGWRWARLTAALLYCVNPFVFNRIFAGQLSLLVGYALLPFAVASAMKATRGFVTEPTTVPSITDPHVAGSEPTSPLPADLHHAGAGPTSLLLADQQPTSSPARETALGGWRRAQAPARASLGVIAVLGPVLWWAVLTAISPHYVWIYGLVLLAVVVVTRPFTWRLVAWLAGACAAMGVLSLYILLPHSATELPTTVGTTSLDLYKTAADPHLGLLPNVAALYGFWRLGPGPQLPKDVVTGWPLLMLAMLVVIYVGFLTVLGRRTPRTDPRRRLAWVLLVVGVLGFLLALGSQGPTGALFRWAYDTVPFFAIMREPQKFLMLTALAYAVGLGWGVQRLAAYRPSPDPAAGAVTATATGTGGPGNGATGTGSAAGTPPGGDAVERRADAGSSSRHRRRSAVVAAAIGMVLPLAYTPTMFDGLAGQIAPSTIPASYRQADAQMGNGPGRILYLPWHLYEALPFTGGRVVATLGPTVFRRTVIAGDNVQAGGVQTQSTSERSAYLQTLLNRGAALTRFGADLAPLGVEYVVLAKAVNWRSYGWLDGQADLRLILRSGALEVWRNLDYRGPGQRPGSARPVRQLSLVAYQVPSGPAGTVTIDAAYQPGWKLDGRAGRPSPEGTVEFTVGTAGGVAQFRPWGLVKLGDALSGGAFVLLAVGLFWARRRRSQRGRSRADPTGPAQ